MTVDVTFSQHVKLGFSRLLLNFEGFFLFYEMQISVLSFIVALWQSLNISSIANGITKVFAMFKAEYIVF